MPSPPDFKPRKKLFLLLCLMLAAWIIALVVIYFTLVFPQGHHLNGAPVQRLTAAGSATTS